MNHNEPTTQVQSGLNSLAAQGKVRLMTNTKTNYQGLFDYAKENSQTRNLFQEYWQQNEKQAPEWQTKLSPKLERSVIPSVALLGLQAKPLSELRGRNIDYSGLLEYAHKNAVHTDLFKTQSHPNLRDWQASLKYKKGAPFTAIGFKKAA
jgi:hypothetical protein